MLFTLEQFFDLVGVKVLDASGRALAVNDEVCRMFRLSRQEMLSDEAPSRVTHPDDLVREEPLRRALLAGERDSYLIRKRLIRSDGEQFDGILSVRLVRDEQGRPREAVGLIVEQARCDDLRDLLDQRDLILHGLANIEAEIALAALRITDEEQVTRRELARTLGVGISTVQGWIDRARRLR